MPAGAQQIAFQVNQTVRRTLNALESVAWDQEEPKCSTTRRNAAQALFGNNGVWKNAAKSDDASDELARLAHTLGWTKDTVTDPSEPKTTLQHFEDLNNRCTQNFGKVGIIFGATQVEGLPELKHCFTIVAAPCLIANRFWVFDTLGCGIQKRAAADEETLARLIENAGPSLDSARTIYKNHEEHLLFGIDNVAKRVFPFGKNKQHIIEWHQVWLKA